MLGLCVLLCTGTLAWRDCLTYTPAWDTLTWFAVLIGMSSQLNNLGVIKAFADAVGGLLATMHLGWMPLFGLLHAAFFLLHYMFASQTAHVGALYSAFCAMMLAAGESLLCLLAISQSVCGMRTMQGSPTVIWCLYPGVPPVLAAMTLAYSVNLFGSITHYASGQVRAYAGLFQLAHLLLLSPSTAVYCAPLLSAPSPTSPPPSPLQAAVYYGSGFMRLNEVFSLGAINGLVGVLLWSVLGMPVWKLLGWW